MISPGTAANSERCWSTNGLLPHWQRELSRDDLTFGQFGENFTVDGLPDDEVRIGDRYRVGAAVVEVTQPRVTCYRVGLRVTSRGSRR